MIDSTKNKIWFVIIIISVILVMLNIFIRHDILSIITAVISAIIASIVISIYYQEQLLSAMRRYNKIGLIEYYSDFEKAQDIIRKSIAKGTEVDIYVMMANVFLGGAPLAIQELLSKKEAKLRIFIYNEDNPFISSYGNHWGTENDNEKYNEEGLKLLIKQVKEYLINLYEEINVEKGDFELFEIKHAPVAYSFYKIDQELFFVPSKNSKAKIFRPPVFRFTNTNDKNCMFLKIEAEINIMINDNELIKIN